MNTPHQPPRTVPAPEPKRSLRPAFLPVLACIFLAAYAFALPTPAGTLIVNQARAVIDDEEIVPSNKTQTLVQEVCVPRLSPAGTPEVPGQRFSLVAPATAYLPYRLANHGNVEAAFALSWHLADGAAWAPQRVAHYHDVNGNGLVDTNEAVVESVVLEAGARLALILAVTPPAGALGDVAISPGADCGDTPANDATSLVQARPATAPALRLQQRVEPVADASVTAMDESTTGITRYRATINLANYGGGSAVSPRVTVDLQPLTAHGFTLDLASLVAAKGTLEVETDSGWRAPGDVSDATGVQRLRLLLDALAPDEDATVVFDLVAPAGTPPIEAPLASEAESDGDDARPRAVSYLDVDAQHLHGLELLTAELFLIEDQTRCFPARLANLGNQADRYALGASAQLADASGVNVTLETTSRLPLEPALALEPGAGLDFLACVRSDAAREDAFGVVVSAASAADGSERSARGTVRAVEPADAVALFQSADPIGTVTAGSEIVYTLTLRNGYSFALTDLRARVDLVDELEFVSAGADGAYTPETRVVRWELDRLEGGAETQIALVLRVGADVADDTVLRNRFTVRAAEIANPLVSNTVTHATWSSALLLEASVSPAEGVTWGDLLTYTLEVTNPSTAPLVVTLSERMPDGVEYLRSERLAADGGDAEPLEPARDGRELLWSDLAVEANASFTVRYTARVLPSAPLLLESRSVARGLGASGAGIASAEAGTSVRIDAGVFERDRGVLLGRIFLDADGDGRYARGLDLPLAGVRVILPNGTQTLTDTAGRYAFRGVEVGPTSLLVDPASLGFTPRGAPNALGTHRFRVQVHGVTVQDVPVIAPNGSAGAARSTELRFGPLTVRKELQPGPEGVEVRLTLSSAEALPELLLTDPVPNGEARTYAFDLFEGTHTLVYTLESTPGGDAILTDPQVRWRYP